MSSHRIIGLSDSGEGFVAVIAVVRINRSGTLIFVVSLTAAWIKWAVKLEHVFTVVNLRKL